MITEHDYPDLKITKMAFLIPKGAVCHAEL